MLDRAPDRIVIHHTSTPNSPDTSLEHAYRVSRDIQRFHMDGRGWADIGQQLTISRGGVVMEGRNRSLKSIHEGKLVLGAHALNNNSHTIGIENEGSYFTKDVPEALWTSLVEVCAWLCVRYRLKPGKAIIGHRDLCDTDCPGDRFYSRLPELREAVSLRLHPDDAEPPPDSDDLRSAWGKTADGEPSSSAGLGGAPSRSRRR